jgi:predicted NBD/HSP70 family sugar kinase
VNDDSLISSSPRRIRQRNEIAALQALHQIGPLTRADLGRQLRVNRSSSGHIIAALAADGLVREVPGAASAPHDPAKAGRPGIRLELIPEARGFIGVEIGVEHMAVVEIDLAANPVATRAEPLDGSSIDVEKAVQQTIDLALRTVPWERLRRCEGFGVSTPAQMDRRGIVRSAPLLGWHDINLVEIVRAALPFQAPVVAENDANAFAIGATYKRDELRSGVTLFLVMESGLGGGIVIDGKLFRGGNGVAGEIGHLRVPGGDGRRTLEQIIGLESVLERYRSVAGRKRSLEDLLAAVASRDPPAVTIARDWANSLAYGLVQACRVIDPDRIVLGGSLAALYPPMASEVREAIRNLQEESLPLPDIAVTNLEGSGPAFGAACILHQRYLSLESPRLAHTPEHDA